MLASPHAPRRPRRHPQCRLCRLCRLLVLELPQADDLSYFPSPDEAAAFDGVIVLYDQPATMRIRYKSAAAPRKAGGVLRIDRGGSTRFYQLDLVDGGR